ncbi:2-hydroxyhexa-2,4-dienoate hydratase [Sinobacterium norvegicum]|uniref:2-hydroxyhexa-2,4-dienoate hydratase n=1 Tax=Sinobacterium norvegicum TaxID=1641715 RepID=A0ABM9AH94_9GAMM|nr:fumarylacetoacetate hydrolase family protein [Sinobacterium norvegicum]CAH0992570.1 2-hydroxyhexa-2,4-dienoate hydratase [Sinobacterium norvegicum]
MEKQLIEQLGDELYEALSNQQTLTPFTDRHDDITIDDAYHISLRMVARRVEAGEKIIGKKIGVTSKVVQDMLGVDQPDFGVLTDKMHYPNGAEIPVAGNLIAPRAEGEIAFKLKKALIGPGITEADVLDATECVMPCFEIVDSRIQDWNIKIQDTVADNASCGVFTIGENAVDPRTLDLPNLHMKVYKNGSLLSEGKGSAVQGNPLTAVAWLANTLGEFGITFDAGDLILSGSLVPLEDVGPGDTMKLELENVGSCEVSFV